MTIEIGQVWDWPDKPVDEVLAFLEGETVGLGEIAERTGRTVRLLPSKSADVKWEYDVDSDLDDETPRTKTQVAAEKRAARKAAKGE